MSENTPMTDAELEQKELELYTRLVRAKGQDGFRLVLEMAEDMAEQTLYQARDDRKLSTEGRIEALNKSEVLSYFVGYVDECIGKAEEVLKKAAEAAEMKDKG